MLTRLLYDFLFSIFSLIYLPIFFLKGKNKGGVGSRFGAVPDEVRKKLESRKVVWVHAVSVGEVALAQRLLNHWRTIFGEVRFVLTVTTVAGFEVASKSKHVDDVVLQFPVDYRFSVRRFIGAIHPAAVVMMETEIWPNLIWEISDKKIPIFILNGRISDRAIGKYRTIRFFLNNLLKKITMIGAQDELMRQRFVELGAKPDRVVVTGNLKFDWEPSTEIPQEVLKVRESISKSGKFWCFAASTHAGEEEMFLDIYLSLRKKYPDFRLFLAPRHPDRYSEVEVAAERKGIRLKRVFMEAQNGYDERSDEPWLLDQMGVLAHLYGAADVVFVGGSLVPVGGHNLVEPAYYGKPILFGPHMNNFSEMTQFFLKQEAGIQTADAQELQERIIGLMGNQKECLRLGENARKLVLGSRGALLKSTQIFREYVSKELA